MVEKQPGAGAVQEEGRLGGKGRRLLSCVLCGFCALCPSPPTRPLSFHPLEVRPGKGRPGRKKAPRLGL